MFDSKYSKFLTILLVIIIVAILGLLVYLGYNYYVNYKINNDSDKYVATFIEEVGNTVSDKNKEGTENILDNVESAEVSYSEGEKKYKGFNVVGTIEIPKTNVKYPILEDPPTVKKLEAAVAVVYPQNAKVNTQGNIVIVGHNYRNGLFFSNNKKLTEGDKIYITGLDGKKVIYKIYSVFEAEENDTSFYNRDTDGAMEITLSTCTDDSSARTIIFAKAE